MIGELLPRFRSICQSHQTIAQALQTSVQRFAARSKRDPQEAFSPRAVSRAMDDDDSRFTK
jgi:hypothetical protein